MTTPAQSLLSLQSKTIIITGGSGLLGYEIAKFCTQLGANAVIADKEKPKNSHHNLHFEQLDITSEASIQSLLKQYDSIDGWINCAYPRTKDWGEKFENIPYHSWQKNVDMHLGGYFLCSQKILEKMRTQNTGVLINIASIYGIVGPDFTIYEGTEMTSPAAYSAIKGGLINLTKYLASYYGKYNIRVNTVSPGGIFDHQPPQFVSKYNQKVPLGRMGTPKDICGSVAFLMTDSAAYITGHNLVVDGGWSII